MPTSLRRILLAAALVPLSAVPVSAQRCLPLPQKLTAPLIRAALKTGKAQVCRKVPVYTQTRSIGLENLRVCLERATIRLSGAVAIVCAAPKAPAAASISETIDFAGAFDLRRCALRELRVTPRSAMGKTMAAGLNLEARLRNRIDSKLELFCR
ncbi:MAG: hypothetical protein AB7F96_12820 [Beijerinckiaceae bacterium]